VIFFIAVIIIAHFFTPPNYDWTQNTISDLASQGHIYKWIMRSGFIGFGLILTIGVVIHFRQSKQRYFLGFVAIYGLSILMSGIFCTSPLDLTIPYSVRDANLHSMFATIAGIAISMGILWQIFVSSTNRERWMRIIFLFLVVGISGLFGLAENHILALDKGIVQRILYLVGLSWLVYEENIIALEGTLYERK
jgi:hypothetical membrane protein